MIADESERARKIIINIHCTIELSTSNQDPTIHSESIAVTLKRGQRDCGWKINYRIIEG
jgi:hypothetical protein